MSHTTVKHRPPSDVAKNAEKTVLRFSRPMIYRYLTNEIGRLATDKGPDRYVLGKIDMCRKIVDDFELWR